MRLKIGELARRSGLTVRTLRHYDDIGLLTPSSRSHAGYRLYAKADIARLHRIQALRRLGISLADIRAVLEADEISLPALIDQQIRDLDARIERSMQLRERLIQLRDQIDAGGDPEPDEWLTTLELMNVYEQYFSREELKKLPIYHADESRAREWASLADEARILIDRGVPPQSAEARTLARRWMRMLEADTARHPRLLHKLDAMHRNEPTMQRRIGIAPRTSDYVLEAFAETKLAIFQRYLTSEEYAFVRERYAAQMKRWPSLLAELREEMEQGAEPDSAEVLRLAQRWLDLFRAYAGDDPETHRKLRAAMENEPELSEGSWLDEDTRGFLNKAVNALVSLDESSSPP
ncbi:MerR family transcriptional regulator [Arhodomonas sp. AD133]|uniref:MerR family transcriptional regulator n=1 Tax=Arhodomonas sp. AD133 TaxID=3415009 RepID=UPI003EB8DFD1